MLFFLGVLHYAGAAPLPTSLQMLAYPAVMAASVTLFVTEFFTDKVPGFDTLWDALHTFVRIPAGALLAAFAVAADDPGLALAAGLIGGVVTAGSHFAKAGARVLINASPEPFTNWATSLSEDFFSLAILWTALKYPLALLVAFALFVVIVLWLLPKLWRGIKRLLDAIRRLPAFRRGG